jgi:hypothetical protein
MHNVPCGRALRQEAAKSNTRPMKSNASNPHSTDRYTLSYHAKKKKSSPKIKMNIKNMKRQAVEVARWRLWMKECKFEILKIRPMKMRQ